MHYLYKSGKLVDPLNLSPEDIDICDIAHNLSHICRFTGSFPFHYSVAHHSLLVSLRMEDAAESREAQLIGLLHDAAEYVCNDLTSHLKHDSLLAGYNQLEHSMSEMILTHFGCDPAQLYRVKPYDDAVYRLEEDVQRRGYRHIQALPIKTVYNAFLGRFHSLVKRFPIVESTSPVPSSTFSWLTNENTAQ